MAASPVAHAAAPSVDAPEAIVVEATRGDVAYTKAADARRPIASTTKLMTALLTLEKGGLKDVVVAPRYRAAPAESTMHLVPGEKITDADLLRGLLVVSANDAAVTLAGHVGGSVPSFVRQMNRRAQELGLGNTHYENPVGLDAPGNYSSARDLAQLTRRLRRFRFFRRTVDANTLTLESGSSPRALTNKNTLLAQYPWVDGVKTGYTSQAGNVLVASGTKRGVHLISVVIGAASKPARNAESVELLNYGFSKYRLKRAVTRGDTVASVPIRHRAGAELPLVASRSVRRVLRRDEHFTFARTVPTIVDGPVHRGTELGRLEVRLDGRPVTSLPLTANLEVPAAGLGRRTQDFLTRPWTLAVVALALLLAAVAARRRPPGRRSTEEAAA
ncbi:MAG: D-alanyl-D-alanine carboxypeptidase family protein [Solirubrobacteraceae bacterium]